MPESKSLQEKGSKLPAVVLPHGTPTTETGSRTVSKRTGILGALAVFAPLAVEVIYGLARKWLAETTTSKPVNEIPDKGKAVKKLDGQPPGAAGYRRRCRGSQN